MTINECIAAVRAMHAEAIAERDTARRQRDEWIARWQRDCITPQPKDLGVDEIEMLLGADEVERRIRAFFTISPVGRVRAIVQELWGIICPDMGVNEFERRILALGTISPVGLPPKDEPAWRREPLDVRNMYELGS